MKRYIVLICAFIVLFTIPNAEGQETQKLAQTGMKFLSIPTDARLSALGDASTSIDGNSTAMFFNPAGMANMSGFATAALGQVNWIADIKYFYGSTAFSPSRGLYGVFGVFFLSVDYGIFKGTIRDPGDIGFLDTGDFSPGAMAIGMGYAKALSSKFSIGGNVKYVTQDLGSSIVGFTGDGAYKKESYKEEVAAFDFGILYRTGFRSLNFGMCIRNFSEEVKYEDEGFQLPLTFKIGISMNALDIYPLLNKEAHSLLVTMDMTHPRDYPEQVNIGMEYLFINMFAIRGGYSTPNDVYGFSAGIGFRLPWIAIDYSFTPFELFKDVHRFTLQFVI